MNQDLLNIKPASGKQIIAKFVDSISNLYIIEEIEIDTSVSKHIYVSTYSLESGELILPKKRINFIDYEDKIDVVNDEVKIITKRILNLSTGYEYFETMIYDLKDNFLFGQKHDAFNESLPENAYKVYKNHQEQEKYEKEKFEKEYASYSLEERIKYWASTLHQQMRWQAESGLDSYAIYNEEWHKTVKEFEPSIDTIMDEVFSKYWGFGTGWRKEEYLKRIGKE